MKRFMLMLNCDLYLLYIATSEFSWTNVFIKQLVGKYALAVLHYSMLNVWSSLKDVNFLSETGKSALLAFSD
jgi:hypothetical protein